MHNFVHMVSKLGGDPPFPLQPFENLFRVYHSFKLFSDYQNPFRKKCPKNLKLHLDGGAVELHVALRGKTLRLQSELENHL